MILKPRNGLNSIVCRDLGIFNDKINYRHSSWLMDTNIFVYGGFELDSPNIPTDIISKVNLTKLFAPSELLSNKLVAYSNA